MKINLSRKSLLYWDSQYQGMRGSFQEVLLRTKINEYYRANGVLINASKEKREALLNEFALKDDAGMFKTEMKGEEGNQHPTLIMKEPIREKEFEEKMNSLMDEMIAVEI